MVLHNQGHEALALTMEMILAGAIYALVVGIVERFTGLRLMSNMAQQITFVMVPPLLLIFLVLGTIFIGLATPTEGGAMGALGSVILAAIKRKLDNNPTRFNWTLVRQATEATAKLSAFVLFILIGARVFSLTFYGVNGHVWVEHLLTSLPGGQVGFLIVVNILVFLLAFFLDFFELAFIIVPLLGPAADKLGIDLIWFGVMLGVNMQTSFMHPPFGFALFFLRSVAPKVPYIDRVTGKTHGAGDHGPDLLGRRALRGHPAASWWRSSILFPEHRDALQGCRPCGRSGRGAEEARRAPSPRPRRSRQRAGRPPASRAELRRAAEDSVRRLVRDMKKAGFAARLFVWDRSELRACHRREGGDP